MASTQKNAGTGTTGAVGGLGGTGVAWTSPGNITTSDNSYATVALSNTNTSSQVLRATNFGISIPYHSTIDGVVCTFERKASAADTIRESHIYLIHDSGSGFQLLGNNKIVAPNFWSTTEGDVSYGGPADKWGATLTSSIVSDSTFGVLINAIYYSGYTVTETAYVDRVYVTLYYTVNFVCGWTGAGGGPIGKIYYGSTQVSKVYYGTVRVA